MSQEPGLRLIPDWPRIRQLIARRLGKTEAEVQSIVDDGDSLDKVELVMVMEEVLGP